MHFLARFLLLVALAFPGAASAQGLFVDVPSLAAARADAMAPAALPGTVKRSRLVGLDLSYFNAFILGDRVQPGAGISLPPILLPLFPDMPLQVQITARDITADGHLVWTGQPQGLTGFVNLVISGIEITGQVQVGDQVIEIRPAPFGLHRIIEINQAAFPSEQAPVRPPASRGAPAPDAAPLRPAAPSPGVRSDANTTLNVLVAYTSTTQAASSDIAAEILLAVTTTNTVYQNSGIPITLNLVGTQLMSGYNESTGSYTDQLFRITETSDGYMDEVHARRTSLQADLVVLMVERQGCGVAWMYDGYPQYAFSVVTRSCATSNLTFPHELGHNMGANHDRYMESGGLTNAYNYGYADPTGLVRTVMAYNDACVAQGVNCTRLPYFSSPDLSYAGRPLGVNAWSTSSAHNVRMLTETRTAIAQYRNGTAATITPASGWWWNSSEAGRGYSIEISNGAIFFAAYTYASDGTALWYVSSGPMSSSTSYSGALQQYEGGQTLTGGYRAATYIGSVGTVRIDFYSATAGYITFPNGSGTSITRFDFVTNGSVGGPASGYPQTGWWWAASEAGRGYFIEAQNTSMFVSFYMYNSAGQATWYVASGAMVSSTLFQGSIQEYAGGSSLSTSSFRAPSTSADRGTVTIQFSGTTAATLTLPNGTQVALSRFTF